MKLIKAKSIYRDTYYRTILSEYSAHYYYYYCYYYGYYSEIVLARNEERIKISNKWFAIQYHFWKFVKREIVEAEKLGYNELLTNPRSY